MTPPVHEIVTSIESLKTQLTEQQERQQTMVSAALSLSRRALRLGEVTYWPVWWQGAMSVTTSALALARQWRGAAVCFVLLLAAKGWEDYRRRVTLKTDGAP